MPTPADFKPGHHGAHLLRLGAELFGRAGGLLRVGRVLLRELVHLFYGRIHLAHALALLVRGRGDLRHDLADTLRVAVDLF